MNNDRKSRGLSGATIISFVVILVVVLWMANQLQMHQQEMTYTSFVSAVQGKNVSDVYINQNSAVCPNFKQSTFIKIKKVVNLC